MALNESRSEIQVKVSLFWQVLLTASVFGLETSLGFFQIYAILFLQYMGVPVSLVSLDGIVTGVFCISVVPVIGYLTDKGANPKARKWWAFLFGNGLLLLGILLFFATTGLNLQKLIKQQEYLNQQQENGSIHFQKSTTTQKNTKFASRETPKYTSPLYYYSYSTSSTFLWPTDAPQGLEIPLTAVLAILCVSFFNIGYDSCASISRAFIMVCMPTNQQSGVLIMVTIVQSLSGTIFSVLGILDLPRFLGPLFGVDGVAISFLLFAVYMLVCIVTGFIITSFSSHHIDRMLKGYEKFADEPESEYEIHDLSTDKYQSVRSSESDATSHNFVKGTIMGVEEREDIPILSNENSNPERTYSSITRDTIRVSHSDMPEAQRGHNRSSMERNRNVIEDQSLSPQEEDDTKLRLNKKLVALCLGYFFVVGGVLSMVEYMPNTLTIGIYQGDPTAFPGTEKHALYQKGLKMAALGNLLYYVTYLMMSLGVKRVLKSIDTEILHVILSTCFLMSFATLLLFKLEALYFINSIVFGPFRTCVFTTPYLLAAKYNQENQVDPQRQAKNIGKVMSLIGIILPTHYFILSTFMGPAMDETDSVWFPLYYGFANICLSFPFFCLLLFWSRRKKKL